MNDAGFIDPNSEWSVTVGENGSVEVNRLDLKAENAKLRERVAELEELTDGKLYIPQEWYQLATTENDKLRKLVDENARLRSCLSDDADNARLIMGENAKLRNQLEEQKCFAADLERDVRALRELVRDMADYGEGAGSGMAEWFVDRMRELGVEQ